MEHLKHWFIVLAAAASAAAFAISCDDNPTPADGDADVDGDSDSDSDTSEYCGGERQPCCPGNVCNRGLTCASGTCTSEAACGRLGQPCCDGVTCESGLVCQDRRCEQPEECGARGQPCCSGGNCQAGLVCDRDTCVEPAACGGERQPCCEGGTCAAGLVCTDGTCQPPPPCGGPRQPCCDGDTCQEGLTCVLGLCQTDTTDCGDEGQACCEGDTCTGRDLACCGGSCVDTSSDPRNCGSCGNRCEGTCTGGACDPVCGGNGQPCCSGERDCARGLECDGGTCRPVGDDCGAPRTACAGPEDCCEGLSCRASPADPICCVESGGECTTSSDCCGWMLCEGGTCACRSGSETCVTNADCCAGLACVAGRCSTEEDPCAEHSDCHACVDASGCGWCDATDTCYAGTLMGPSGGVECGDWDWFSLACDNTDVCSTSTDCASCVARATCGWCLSSEECMTGEAGGPTDGSCETWQWTSRDCGSDPCGEETVCRECVARSGCGWCDSTDSCHVGGMFGPDEGECDDWDTVSWTCDNTDVCSVHETCEDCTADADCGWCEATRSCHTGGAAGPDTGGCEDAWIFEPGSCGIDPCSDAGDCRACTDRGTCGWCADSDECLTGTAWGPREGACDDWSWVGGECPVPGGCGTITDCGACIDASGCGWCDSTDECLDGGFFGPESGDCDDWDWYSWTCDNTDACSTSTTCGECTSRGTCGWCNASDECMTGTSAGPSEGSCSDWDWLGTSC